MPTPFKHASGKWAVQYGAKLSGTGKPKMVYYSSKSDATKDIARRQKERKEHGASIITGSDREWLAFLKSQLNGDLSQLPEVVAHWRSTGSGAVEATLVEVAVKSFLAHQLPQVKHRTKSDIRHRLNKFTEVFQGREMHSIHGGEIEKWLYRHDKAWTRRSYWKRIAPLFDYALRHRMIAENPLELLEAPKTKRQPSRVYSPEQFVEMLKWSQIQSHDVMRPFLALSGLCFLRTAELVRLYEGEKVLRWENILWDRKLVHVPADVAKETRRDNDERFVPFPAALDQIVSVALGDSSRTGMIVPLLHHDFSKLWRQMHADLDIPPIRNGMRKNAISYALAANPDLAISQCARWAGNSEATIKKHYLESISQEDGKRWFDLPMMF